MGSTECPLCWIEAHTRNPTGFTKCRKLNIDVMAEYEGLEIRVLDMTPNYMEYNIYSEGEARYAINRIAGKLKRKGCTIHRFGDPNSIRVRCPKIWRISGDKTCNPEHTRYMQRGQTLPARQMWLLEEMCRRIGVDTMLIDSRLTYWENKENIERQTGQRLRLKEKENNNDLFGVRHHVSENRWL